MAKKIWELMQEDIERNKQASENLQREANEKFNNLVSKKGEYDTSKHTSNVKNITNAYRQTSKTSANNFKKANKLTVWDSVMNIAQGLKNTTDRYSNNNMQNLYDNINNLRNNSEQAMYNRAKENNMNANFINNVQNNAKAYNEAIKKYQNDQIKNTVEYQNQKQLNTNMSENSLIEKAKEKMENTENNFDEYFKNLSKTERNQEISKIRQMLSNKDGLFETEEQKNKNKKIINDLILKSEVIDAEKKAEKVNKTLNEGNFIQRATTATGELASSMGKSAMDMTISPALTVGSLAEEILPTKDFKGPKFDEAIDYKKLQDYADAVKNENIELKLLKTGKRISSTIGGMVPSIIANIVLPGSNVGMIAQASGVAGEDYIENLNEDKSNKLQSAFSGTLKGLGSYATEKITGGNILGKGSLDDWATRTIANGTSKIENETLKKITQKIASKIYEVGGENFEELLENQIDHLVDTTVNNKGITFKEWLDEQSETVKQTTLTQLFLNLMGVGGDTYNEVQEYSQNAEMKQWINEVQKIIDKENLNIDNYKINNNNINEVRKTLNELPIENATANSQQQSTQAQQILPTQQINQQQNKVVQNRNTEQVKVDSENFAKQIDEVKKGTFPKNDMLVLGNTPQVLKDIGLKDLPITMTQKHLDTIMNESGKHKGANYHGLGEEIVKQLPQAINNPLDIVKSNTKDDSIVLTTYLADKQNRTVIASIKIDGKGTVNDIRIDTNVMTSAYGRNNYEKFMEENIKNGNLLYDIDRGVIKKVTGARLQLPRTSNSSIGARLQLPRRDASINNIIPQNNGNMQVQQEISKEASINLPQNQKNINSNNTSHHSMPIAEKYIENNLQKYNRYKKNILDSRAKEVNNLISYKNNTIRNIENKILEKETLLNSKKDKNTKTASVLRLQIENLKTRKQKIENLYNEKIDKVNSKTNRDKINFETRNTIKKEARENLKAEISPLTEDLTKYKDKKAGILYNRETAQRNIDDIVLDKELAQAIKETIFDPIQVHQAQKTKEINGLFDKINSLNLDKTKKYEYTAENSTISGEITDAKKHIKIDEATLAQLLIENKITNKELKNNYNMSNEQIEKINKTADTFTEILDYLYNRMNEEQIKYGYSPIGKINNYFPHFFENKPDTMLGKIASYFGIDITKQDLPTEIAGKTDTFKPGKTWNSNTLQRKTNKTDYDALKAMEKYIQGATDIIYTTEDIQKIREYERQIRYQYSDKGIQESIDNIVNNSELTQEAKDSAIDGVFKNSENELSNFVTWLNDYGNTLANKKSFSDRNMERNIGRNLYSSMSGIESRIASNTIGGNLSVSLTNFAPLFQATGTTKVNYLLTGMLQTTSNNIKGIIGNKNIDFVDNSNFLTNRFGTNTIADRTVAQKISDVASIPMNIIDEFTAESIVRGKYLENIDKGMTEEQALDNADKYAAKIMADRSKGALPIIFNAKNPISKLTTMFQVEPNNIISNYLKDMPREAKNKIELTKRATKLMVASYAFNTLVMAIKGGNEVLPDPVRWVSYLLKAITGEDEEKEQARTDLMESIIGSIPFASNVAGLFGFEDIGRVPISNAMPNLANIAKVFDSEADSKYRKETAMKELLKPFLYLGLPTGGAQIKKTLEGISTVLAGGSYKTDKEGNKILQFPVENPNTTDYVRAGILGKYSLPMAREYQDRNFKSLSAKQTKTYEESNLPFKEYLEYIDQKLKSNEDKINYLSEQDWNENQKWGIYMNDIFSSTEREKDGSSQLSDAKYITSNGISKSEYIKIYNKAQKNNIDMPTAKEYKEMKTNNITLKNYIEYKVEVKELTENKRNSKELSSTENLKNADKIQILLDSNYSTKEISGLYANYIKSSSDTEYDIMKATGIDTKEYLKYKQQEFTTDKTDDGTLNGKTVSKSKQKKLEDYLNSMDIEENQKLLLYAIQGYSTTNSQKTQLANYVYGLDLEPNTKLELYNKFSGFTVYKDGRVKW